MPITIPDSDDPLCDAILKCVAESEVKQCKLDIADKLEHAMRDCGSEASNKAIWKIIEDLRR